MEPKKTIFSERPALIESEGSVARINFDIEESTEVTNQGEGQEGEAQTQTVYLAHMVRVEQPLTVPRIKAALTEAGFDEDRAEEQAALTLLAEVQAGKPVGNEVALAKQVVTARINQYDKSDAVNQFTLGGVPIWLGRELRKDLDTRFKAEAATGKEKSTLWYEGHRFEVVPAEGLQMLVALEVYASECYDKTAEHKAAVAALDDVNAILNYDYKAGYPEQPAFGEPAND